MSHAQPYAPPASLYRALGDPTRLRILAMLKVREVCVCELAERLPMTQPAVSHHLRILRACGLVAERREKKWTYYCLAALAEDSPAKAALAALAPLPEDRRWLEEAALGPLCFPVAIARQRGAASR